MAQNLKIPTWVTLWLVIASILVSIDSLYVLGVGFNFKQYIPNVILSLWSWYGESDEQYSQSGILDGNGWVLSQSLFNVIEVFFQLLYIFVLPPNKPRTVLILLLVSMATWWKTLLYMSIILTSADPVHTVPGLYCLGYQPLDENLTAVQTALTKDGCLIQLFKFHFNFYWLLFPFLVIVICCQQIIQALSVQENQNSRKKN